MKALSVFIDESGDFGPYNLNAPYYLVSLVFHDQSISIEEQLKRLDASMRAFGLQSHAVHTGPLIRREGDYINMAMDERRHIFNRLFHFARTIEFTYTTLVVDKRHLTDKIQLNALLSKQLASFLQANQLELCAYDSLIVYYDNGQMELTKVIVSVFSAILSHVEFRKILPVDYRLAQVADLTCTLELAAMKAQQNQLSKSDLSFFGCKKDLYQSYLRQLRRKKL